MEDYCLSDLHAMDVETLQWEKIGEADPLVLTVLSNITSTFGVIFGGLLLLDLHAMDVETLQWEKIGEADIVKSPCLALRKLTSTLGLGDYV